MTASFWRLTEAKISLASGTAGAWFTSRRGVTVRPDLLVLNSYLGIKPHCRRNKAYVRVATPGKVEIESEEMEKKGRTKRY